jgi:hypothetical protein
MRLPIRRSCSLTTAPYAEVANPRVVEELEERRRAVFEWWTRFKATQQRRVKDLVDRSFARSHASA